MDKPTITLPTELVQAIGNYLVSRPEYREIAALVAALQQAANQAPTPEKTTPPKKAAD